jgi:putative DNA primase/helicase
MKLLHDGPLWISTGRQRFEKSWRVKEILWSELCLKMSTPVTTNETYKEYLDMGADGQASIKDVGGFVGGVIQGGRRKKGSVLTRQLLTFDLDYAPPGFTDDLSLLFDNAIFVYSTHKHSDKTPRYRLVMPLDRDVMPDQYQAIARKVSEIIGIDWFDPTTYQPERLMYWPSVSNDMELVTWAQDGAWLSADYVLGLYKDWTDLSQWPTHPLENKKIESDRKKQEDPTEKKGLVGVFCRVYGIEAVIAKYLPDEYIDTGVEGRYSYVHGSTAMGVVTYEDKYAFSHHATDPASGVLCNSFDLVRLHRFKDKDDNVDDKVPTNRLPSYLAMLDLCREDPEVRALMGKERYEEAIGDFQIVDADGSDMSAPIDVNLDWMAELEADRKGNYVGTVQNVLLIMCNDAQLKEKFWYDQFNHLSVCRRKCPWHNKSFVPGQDMADSDLSGLRWYLETVYKISNNAKVKDALEIVLLDNQFHPIRNYLGALVWDGKPRLNRLFIDYLGAEPTAYTLEVTRKCMVACVARVYDPGIKFDNVPIIIGEQGTGKSTILSKLGGIWHSDNFGSVKTKEAAEQLRGIWIMEIGELAGLKKAEVNEIKLFISRQYDRFRPSYGIHTVKYPRQNVFFGTSNEDTPLEDATGGRRFWPITTGIEEPTKDVFNELTRDVIDQIWAEACTYYWDGEDIFLSHEMEAAAKAVQREHLQEDDRTDIIKEYLEKKLPETWDSMNIYRRREFLAGDEDLCGPGTIERTRVTVSEIWVEALGGSVKDINRYATKPIHDIMRSMPGWSISKKRKQDPTYGRQKIYVKQDSKNLFP